MAALVLTAWDVSMDPAMVSTTHWLWHLPNAATEPALRRVFLAPLFYGMPLTNWLGWLLTGFIVARGGDTFVKVFTRKLHSVQVLIPREGSTEALDAG